MGQINDELYKDLVESGYEGHINDMLYKWLGDNSYAGSTLPERMFSYGGLAKIIRDVLAGEFGFNPLQLFSQGEQGAWYDPSDLTTLYQDAAGTIPVTADGDPVGRMEDKSGNGNHATQSVAASRPVYQRGDSRGVVNLLKWSEAFDNTVWTTDASRGDILPNQIAGPRGEVTADLLQANAAGRAYRYRTGVGVVGQPVTFSVEAKQQSSTPHILIRVGSIGANFDLSVGAVTTVSAGGTADIENIGAGWYRLSVHIVSQPSTLQVIELADNGTQITTGSTSSYITGEGHYLASAQVEQAANTTPYQRNDSHLGGVATGSADDLHWLADDKVDDEMTTTLPAMPTATVATATDDGVVINYPVNIPAGAYSVDTTSTQGFDYGRVIVDRQLTAPEQTTLTTYLEDKS